MKFTVNVKRLYETTKAFFGIVLSSAECPLTIDAQRTTLKFTLQSECTKAVLELKKQDLINMGYFCANQGKMTVKATALKKCLTDMKSINEVITASKNNKTGWVIKGGKYKSKRPLQLYDAEVEYSPEDVQHSIQVKGEHLYDAFQKLYCANIMNSIDIHILPTEIRIKSEDGQCIAVYIIRTKEQPYLKQFHFQIKTNEIKQIKSFFSFCKSQRITVSITGDASLQLKSEKSPVVSVSGEVVSKTQVPNLDNAQYHYQLNSRLNEWKLLNVMKDKNEEPTKVKVDYFEGTVTYSQGDEYVGFPIDYSVNSRYYSPELLKSVKTDFSCKSKYIQKILRMGDPKDIIKIHFAPKKSDRKTIKIEFPVKDKNVCQMYYVCVARKEGA